MDRRHFLAASSCIAATAAPLAQAALSSALGKPKHDPGQHVQFVSDGLGLTPAQYAAMLATAVADPQFSGDNYSLGGAIEALEEKFAKLLGKQAALFLPTGTLANHLAIRKLAGADRRVLLQAESHCYNDSGDCAQTLSGLNLLPLAAGRATFTLDDVKQWATRSAGGRVQTPIGVVAIESPVRRCDHAMFDFDEMRRICNWAREQGIRLHLDGARLFNLPLHSGHAIGEYTALFDTVYVSLWKHFNAASGAILAGDAAFIEGLFHERRMFGGALPHAWPQAAVAAHYIDSYEQDYAAAWRAADTLIQRLEAHGHFQARKLPDGTSRLFLKLINTSHDGYAERIQARGIGLAPAHPDTGEFALQVNPSILRVPTDELARVFIAALNS